MEWVRARISGSLRCGEFSQEFGPGAAIDLDHIVGVDASGHPVQVRQLLEGRLECFSPVEPTVSPFAPAPDVIDDQAQDGPEKE